MSVQSESEPANVSMSELHDGTCAVVNRVHETRVPVVITRRGKVWAKIVPVEEAFIPFGGLIEMGDASSPH